MLRRFLASEGPGAFDEAVRRLARRGDDDFSRVEGVVGRIVRDVRDRGDLALLEYIREFEKRVPRQLFTRTFDGAAALARLPRDLAEALTLAADRIRAFHLHQVDHGFRFESHGAVLGTRVSPLASVAVYAPGGKARYPSSVLMAAIPARVAGVPEITLATPLSGDAADDVVLAAAHLAGVTSVLDAGGAQAVSALAHGTQSVPRVDKIVGPGNLYVACAKRMVQGTVAIDSIAGPSEILVLADDSARPEWVAADLLSQAEHDEEAYALLVCESEAFADAVDRALGQQLATLPRRSICEASLRGHGAALVVPFPDRAREVASRIAAEHLSLHVANPEGWRDVDLVAGAIFVGAHTPEAVGDYLAGPSHVLPTGGSVRFGAPLGVYDFVRRTSVVHYSREALTRDRDPILTLARAEGLEAHARAVEVRH